VRQRQLAMLLSSLPPHPCGDIELEQYTTSGDIAASWLAQIAAFGDLSTDSSIADLGAGNGILGIGAALMGVSQVVLVEVDEQACSVAFQSIEQAGVSDYVEIFCKRVDDSLDLSGADLIISNPPWGTQNPKSDRPFLDAIIRSNTIAHLMHSAEATHIETIFKSAGWEVERYWETDFALPAAYSHHYSRQGKTRVGFWRLLPPV
jgi:putative methylase